MKRSILLALLFCLVGYANLEAQAGGAEMAAAGNQTRVYNVWDGSSSTAWGVAANWSLNLVPTSAHDVLIPSAPSNQPVITSGTRFCNILAIESGANLTIGTGSLRAYSDCGVGGSLVMNSAGGSLTVDGNMEVAGLVQMTVAASITVGGTLVWDDSSTENVSAGSFNLGRGLILAEGSTLDLEGSTTTFGSATPAIITSYSNNAWLGGLVIGNCTVDYEYTGITLLAVFGNLAINAGGTLNLAGGRCIANGTTTIEAGGALNKGDGQSLGMNGDLILRGSLSTGTGTVYAHEQILTYATGYLEVHGGSFINDLEYYSYQTAAINCGLSVVSGTLEISDGHLSLGGHATRVFTDATIKVGEGFLAIDAGAYHPTGGALYVIDYNDGEYSGEINVTGGNYLSNLYIQRETNSWNGMVALYNDLTVTGNITIDNGWINMSANLLTVGGDWINNVGGLWEYDGFAANDGTVVFNKAGGLQTVSGINYFFNVTDNHSGAALTFTGATTISGTLAVNNIVSFHNSATLNTVLNTNPAGILAFYYDFASTIASYTSGGALRSFYAGNVVTVNAHGRNDWLGSLTADAGHLVLHDEVHLFEVNCTVNILNGGVIDLDGISDILFAYSGNSALNMSSGELNSVNHGVIFYSSTDVWNCAVNVTGGRIRCNEDWKDYASNFRPTGGTVELTGSASAQVYVPYSNLSWMYNLAVNKAGGAVLIDNINIQNQFIIQAGTGHLFNQASYLGSLPVEVYPGCTFNLNGSTFACSGSLVVNGTLKLDAGAVLKMAGSSAVTIYNGGTLETIGNSTTHALFTHNVSGFYGLNIENNATLKAAYTDFEYMDGYGLRIKSGAHVDGNLIEYCSFRNGAEFSNLITVINDDYMHFRGLSFPTNTWNGTINVAKYSNAGCVYLSDYNGGFAGPAHESDPYTRIFWSENGLPPIQDLTITKYPGVDAVLLEWGYAPICDGYWILRSSTPEGPFTYWNYTTGSSWVENVTQNPNFYRIRAVIP